MMDFKEKVSENRLIITYMWNEKCAGTPSMARISGLLFDNCIISEQ